MVLVHIDEKILSTKTAISIVLKTYYLLLVNLIDFPISNSVIQHCVSKNTSRLRFSKLLLVRFSSVYVFVVATYSILLYFPKPYSKYVETNLS